ncbi:MAG TPA: ATP-binding cassette domain-containing protein, partial [Acetobacteraceae bacterium]|nr:ATP-binding cassette domain-containing protein [Acetobacteraceae bacterium]
MSGQSAAASLTIERLTRRFGQQLAVDEVSLSVAPGEMIVLLGPSGCGKTTTLRVIAGFEAAGEDVALADEARDEGRCRALVEIFLAADLLDAAFAHDDEAVR